MSQNRSEKNQTEVKNVKQEGRKLFTQITSARSFEANMQIRLRKEISSAQNKNAGSKLVKEKANNDCNSFIKKNLLVRKQKHIN